MGKIKKQKNKNYGDVVNGNKYGLDEEILIENARKNLHAAVTEEYISDAKVVNCCTELKKLLPEDPLANFYEIAVMGTPRELEQHLLTLECRSLELSDLEEMALFLIKSLRLETCNAVAMFIDRIGGVNSSLHERIATRFDEEAPKVDDGIYELTLPRDVFVAYRSTDMNKVVEFVRYLEETEGLRCFVSYRNLQHGRGAKDHYDEWLETAMDHCKVLVFVSSVTSRREGDARHKELPYVEKQDRTSSPAEYRATSDYTKIPKEYKKPRVEYVIEPYTGTKREGYAKVFFDGFTRRESPEAVAEGIFAILNSRNIFLQRKKNSSQMPAIAPKPAEPKAENVRKVFRYANGDVYEGEFRDGKRNGHGVYRFINGDVYDGEYKDGKRNGHGALRLASGIVLEGEWKDGELIKQLQKGRKVKENQRETLSASNYPTLENHDETEFEIEGTVLKEYKGKATEVKIPLGVTSIGGFAFFGCSSLASIVIPNSVTSIDGFGLLFSECSSLERIEVAKGNPVYHSAGNCLIETKSKTLVAGCKTSIIPKDGSVTSIDVYAFHGCSSLTSIVIPDSVISIGNGAFCCCSLLTHILISKNVTSVGDFAFERCISLESLEVAQRNPVYHSAGNCLIETKSKILVAGCRTSIIPKDGSVTSIGDHAFSDCHLLKSIEIPDSVTSIGNQAFSNCKSLKSIKVPNSVTSIGYDAFRGCDLLKSIVIPDRVTSIGLCAFSGCSSLTSIVIPNSVTSIGNHAFYGCSSLTIYCEAQKQPGGWWSLWNPDDRPEVWGYKK